MQAVRVLVVEDESIVAEDLRERLTKMGNTVVGPVATGEQAIDVAERNPPDLVLMDIRLKGRLDGVETADWLRRKLHLPVIYLTAHSDEVTLERAKKTNPQGYLLKPFEESDLRVNIELAMSKHAMEQRLRESEHRYATTLASIGDGVIATDSDSRITYMNPVAEKLTRWASAEVIGRPLDYVFRIINEVSRQAGRNPMAQALREGVSADLEDHTLLVTKDGKEVPIDDCAAPIFDQEQQLQGGVLVFRDVSEKRQSAEIERKVHEQLQWSQRLEAIGRFAGGMAHEINNMLTVVMGCGELLSGQLGQNHPLRPTLEAMLSAGDRTATLIRQLLAFSRKQHLAPRSIDLNDVLTRLQELFGRLIGAQVELVLRLDPGLDAVHVDRMQWEQVLVNLALNARDAMPGGGMLTLETRNVVLDEAFSARHPQVAPGRYVLLAVRDTGCGMDAKTQAHIFEPFFTTKDFGKGTGLGLPMVYGIVSQSGGHVFVDSAVGKGTTFTIYLPAVLKSDRQSSSELARPTLPGGCETVLLAEDEESVRLYVAQSLRQLGYTVVEAKNAMQALQLAEAMESIQLLLTDVVMPKMVGTELAARAVAKRPDLKVLYMSGYADEKLFPPDVSTEGLVFLQKPFTVSALAYKVRAVLDAKHANVGEARA